jgi:hypothetical protein
MKRRLNSSVRPVCRSQRALARARASTMSIGAAHRARLRSVHARLGLYALSIYPKAQTIRVVLDNLSTHKPGALYDACSPTLARAIHERLEFHYLPKRASWLNMVEIEVGVLVRQCPDRRTPDRGMLQREIAAWQRRRNDAGARLRWLFGIEQARHKLGRAYPEPPKPQWPMPPEPVTITGTVY